MAGNRNAMSDMDFEKQEIQMAERAKKFREQAKDKMGAVAEVVDIYSDGVRMSATIWRPAKFIEESSKNPAVTYPAILLAHGFGGKRYHLDYSYAPAFCAAGFIVLTFSYRGWDDSDGVIVAKEKIPTPDKDGNVTMKVHVVRKIVDPEWQLRDIDSALNYLVGVKGVDTSRIGLWGSSFGGGHALAIAARDPRIKCVVCQIGSIDTHSNWVNRHPQYRGEHQIRQLATSHAKGEVHPWTISRPIGLDGMPNLPKTVFEHTKNTISSLKNIRVPVLLLAAEKEELFHNSKNSDLVYEKLKGQVPVEIQYLPGSHYDAYGGDSYKKGFAEATKWFQVYIGLPPSAAEIAAAAKKDENEQKSKL